MILKKLQKKWERFSGIDPLWAIITWEDKRGGKWDIKEFFEYGREDIADLMEYINSLNLKIKLNYNVALDFGCGIGRLTQPLSDYFDKVIGVDIACSMVELANKYNTKKDKCAYIVNETDNLGIFNDNTFDFIYSILTLQHIKPEYSKKYIREFLRVLSPGGLLIFQLPSEPALNSYQEKSVYGNIKKFVKNIIPATLLDLYRNMKYFLKGANTMDMHGIKREEVVNILNVDGGEIIDIKQSNDAGREWVSFRYCVRKK